MIAKIFINKLNQLVTFNDNICLIKVNDPLIYRNMFFDIEENIVYSENNIDFDFSSKGIIIKNPLLLEVNDKKIINALYKKLDNLIDEKLRENLLSIEMNLMDFLDNLIMKVDVPVEFNNELSTLKLFGLYQMSFKEYDGDNYLEYLLSYLKIMIEFLKIKVIVSFNLLNVLNSNEIEQFKKELKLLEINLLDISLTNSNKIISEYVVDEEWCVF